MPHILYIQSFFSFFPFSFLYMHIFLLFVRMFSTCTGLAEKDFRIRFPYGLRVLFCTCILELFIFVLLNCESLQM